MPGVSIGGATYTLSVDDAAFVATLQRAQQAAEQRAQAIRRQLGALPIGANTQQLQQALAEAEREAARAAGQIQNRLGQIGPAAAGAGQSIITSFAAAGAAMAATTFGIQAVVSALESVVVGAVAMNAKLETTTLQFKTLTGSASVAQAHVADLFEFARRTPFETQPIIETSRKLRVMGGAALDTKANLTLLGDTAAATNAPIEELGFWTGRLFSSAMAGRPFGEASNRLQELGVISGDTRNQLEQLQAQGASGDDVFAAFTTSLERYNGAMTEQAHTFEGLSSTFTDNVKLMSAVALAPVFDEAKVALEQLNDAFASPEAQTAIKDFAIGLRVTGIVVGDVAKGIFAEIQPFLAAIKAARDAVEFLDAALLRFGINNTHGAVTLGALVPGLNLVTGAFHNMLILDSVNVALETARDEFDNINTSPARAQVAALTDEFLKLLAAGEKAAVQAQQVAGSYGRLASGQASLPIPKAQNERLAKEAQTTADQIVQREQESIRQRQAAYDRGADAAIASAERERDGLLAASEAKRDGALEALKAQQKASDAYYAVQQRSYERDRDAALKVADDVKTASLASIKAREDAETARVDTLIRNNERERDRELASQQAIYDYQVEQGRLAARKLSDSRTEADRLTRDSRHEFDQARATDFAAQTAADKTRHEQRVANLKQEADSAKAAGDLALKAIDTEKSALQGQADQALKGLDAQRNAEQRRHDAAIANIDQEAARQSAAIQAQLDALDATAAAENRQREDRGQQGNVATARQGVREARQSGDPEAIKRAQLDLAQALDAISQTRLNRQRDAERTSLQAQLANVQQRAQAEKDAADKALAVTQQRLDAEKQATQDNLATVLASLAQRAEAEKTATDRTLVGIQSRTDAEKADFDAHTAAAQSAYAADSARIEALRQQRDDARADQRLKEDRDLEDSNRAQQAANDDAIARIHALYDDPDTGILAKIKADQDASKIRFQAERDDAQRTYDDEAARVHTLYDDPDNGLLAKLALAKTASDDAFERTTARINGTYADETAKVNLLYNGPFGLVQRLKDTKTASDAYFDKANKDWSAWGDATKKALDDANPRLLDLIKSLQDLQKLGAIVITDQNDPGGVPPGANPAGARAAGSGGKLSGSAGHAFPFSNYSGNDPHATYPVPGATDLFMPEGTPIHAVFGGKVTYSAADRPGNPGGNSLTVSGDDGLDYYYAHMLEAPPGNGATIAAGQVIGHVSDTGNAKGRGAHLHIGIGHGISSGTGAAAGAGAGFNAQDFLSSLLHGTEFVDAGPDAGAAGQTLEVNILGQKVKITVPGGVGGDVRADGPIADFLAQTAKILGFVKPTSAVEVALSEGGVSNWVAPGDYNTNGAPSSFGPLQLHYGNLGYPNSSTGIGDDFTAQTHLDARKVEDAPEGIQFALKKAKASGWGAWHGKGPWNTDAFYGITHMAGGGKIDRPTLMLDMATRRPYAIAGEKGTEHVVPMRGSSPAAVPPPAWSQPAMGPMSGAGDVYVQMIVGGRALEDFTVRTMDLAQRDGRFRAVPRA